MAPFASSRIHAQTRALIRSYCVDRAQKSGRSGREIPSQLPYRKRDGGRSRRVKEWRGFPPRSAASALRDMHPSQRLRAQEEDGQYLIREGAGPWPAGYLAESLADYRPSDSLANCWNVCRMSDASLLPKSVLWIIST